MTWPIIIGVVGVLIVFAIVSRSAMAPLVSPEDAKKLLSQGGQLVDVRSADEYASGHIDGAKNIPVDAIGARAGELGDIEKPVVVYCRSGARSSRAKNILESKGYKKVYNLGAISNWK